MQRLLLAGFAALTLLVVIVPSPPVAATEQIPTSASSTYTVEPDKGRIRVSVTLKISNRIPNTSNSQTCYGVRIGPDGGGVSYSYECGTVTRYYVNETWLIVERGATNLKVTSNGGAVTTRHEDTTDFYRSYKLTFPRIFGGQSRTITATYTIPGGAPRSATTHRVNGAYLDFWASTQPMDSAKVTIRVPTAFEIDVGGSPVQETTKGDQRILSSGTITRTTEYLVTVTGSNPDGFDVESITTADGRTVSILGWPGDDEWMEAVRGEASTALPALERLIGQPLPGEGDILVQETADAVLGYQYIGTYDPESQLARVSEDYTQDGTVAHELSHAWFNDDLFAESWLSEGYAGWVEHAAGAVDDPCPAPTEYPTAGSPRLGIWRWVGPRSTEAEQQVVQYQYAASCALITRATEIIGEDRMREVLGVLATDEGAYAGIPDAAPGEAVGWQDWLDAVDERGLVPAGAIDSAAIDELLLDYGVVLEADLAARTAARAALHTLRGETAWVVPEAVVRPMASWAFDDATTAIAAATETYELVHEVESLLPSVDAAANPVRRDYEAADDGEDLEAARSRAADQREAAAAVAAAVAASAVEPGIVERIGLLGTEPAAIAAAAVVAVEAFELDAAHAGAAQVQALLGGASDAGLLRIGIVVGIVTAVILLVAFLVLRRRARRRHRADSEKPSDPAPSYDGS